MRKKGGLAKVCSRKSRKGNAEDQCSGHRDKPPMYCTPTAFAFFLLLLLLSARYAAATTVAAVSGGGGGGGVGGSAHETRWW